jgi:hypothetical protein
MRVGPTHYGPPSCEGLLCTCCVGVVNLTFSKLIMEQSDELANALMEELLGCTKAVSILTCWQCLNNLYFPCLNLN